MNDVLLGEFDQEMSHTRKTLERVPEDRFEWRPHQKSETMGRLAGHLANLPTWAALTVDQDEFDTAPGGTPVPSPPAPETTAELVARFDKNAAEARAAIVRASDEKLGKPWSLLHDGNTLLTLPRHAVLRSFVFNHIVHHRAQLGVYLRLNDIPVPSIYGPSADENPFGG